MNVIGKADLVLGSERRRRASEGCKDRYL